MTALFQSGPLKKKVDYIAGLTYTHTKNLGLFVFSYNAMLVAGRLAYRLLGLPMSRGTGRPAAMWHSFAAGAVGGWFVWGKYSGVNYQVMRERPPVSVTGVIRGSRPPSRVASPQIVLYLLSRIIIAWCKNLAAQGVKPFCLTTFKSAYPFLAAAVWANVMYLFEARRGTLHKSLARSMDFLYHDSNRWQTLSDFLPSPATVAVLVYYFFYVRVKATAAGHAAKVIQKVPTGV